MNHEKVLKTKKNIENTTACINIISEKIGDFENILNFLREKDSNIKKEEELVVYVEMPSPPPEFLFFVQDVNKLKNMFCGFSNDKESNIDITSDIVNSHFEFRVSNEGEMKSMLTMYQIILEKLSSSSYKKYKEITCELLEEVEEYIDLLKSILYNLENIESMQEQEEENIEEEEQEEEENIEEEQEQEQEEEEDVPLFSVQDVNELRNIFCNLSKSKENNIEIIQKIIQSPFEYREYNEEEINTMKTMYEIISEKLSSSSYKKKYKNISHDLLQKVDQCINYLSEILLNLQKKEKMQQQEEEEKIKVIKIEDNEIVLIEIQIPIIQNLQEIEEAHVPVFEILQTPMLEIKLESMIFFMEKAKKFMEIQTKSYEII